MLAYAVEGSYTVRKGTQVQQRICESTNTGTARFPLVPMHDVSAQCHVVCDTSVGRILHLLEYLRNAMPISNNYQRRNRTMAQDIWLWAKTDYESNSVASQCGSAA